MIRKIIIYSLCLSSFLLLVCFIFMDIVQGTLFNVIVIDSSNINGLQILQGNYPELFKNDFTNILKFLAFAFEVLFLSTGIFILTNKFTKFAISLNIVGTIIFIYFLIVLSNLHNIYAEAGMTKHPNINFTFDFHFSSKFEPVVTFHYFASLCNLILLFFDLLSKKTKV